MKRAPVRRTIQVDYIFDIETEAWSNFVVGGLLDCATGEFSRYWYPDERAYAEKLISLEGTLWAHNGGRFDALWLCEWLRRLEISAEIYASSARITLIRAGRLEVRDSAALIPLSLAQAAAIGGAAKAETALPCICRDVERARRARVGLDPSCGGYCSIRRDMRPVDRIRLEGYLETDCRVTAKALDAVRLYSEVNDLDLRGTIGASAWCTAKRRYDLEPAAWDWTRYAMARRGYYGGRVQVFRPIAEAGFCYDMNSAYPAALARMALPVGTPKVVAGKTAARAFADGKPGIYTPVAHVPGDIFIPPLPWRSPTGRICYPVGTFTGSWCAPELQAAEAAGVSFERFGASLVWPLEEKILAPFAEWGWSLRADAGKNSPMGKWLKLFLNSLTGKLAQKPEAEMVYLSAGAPEVCPADGDCKGETRCGKSSIGCCPHRCTGACGVARPLGRFDSAVWTKTVRRLPDNGHIQFAGYLTAGTRVALRAQLTDDGQDGRSSAYCDTDGIKALSPRTRGLGPKEELGAWLFEGAFTPFVDGAGRHPGFESLGPKTYRENLDGKVPVVKAKGIAEPDWESMRAHESQTIDRGVVQFRTAAGRENFFTRKVLSRSLRFDGVTFGDRTLGEDGLTYPPRLG